MIEAISGLQASACCPIPINRLPATGKALASALCIVLLVPTMIVKKVLKIGTWPSLAISASCLCVAWEIAKYAPKHCFLSTSGVSCLIYGIQLFTASRRLPPGQPSDEMRFSLHFCSSMQASTGFGFNDCMGMTAFFSQCSTSHKLILEKSILQAKFDADSSKMTES